MQEFSAEGVSNASLEAALANAFLKAFAMGARREALTFSIQFARQDADGMFRVSVYVREVDTVTGEDEEEDGDRRRHRLEKGWEGIRGLLFYHVHQPHLPDPDMAEIYEESIRMVEESVPEVINAAHHLPDPVTLYSVDIPVYVARLLPLSDESVLFSPRDAAIEAVLDGIRAEEAQAREERHRHEYRLHHMQLAPHPVPE